MKTQKEFKLLVTASGTLNQIADALQTLSNELNEYDPLSGDETFEDNVMYAELEDTGQEYSSESLDNWIEKTDVPQ